MWAGLVPELGAGQGMGTRVTDQKVVLVVGSRGCHSQLLVVYLALPRRQ